MIGFRKLLQLGALLGAGACLASGLPEARFPADPRQITATLSPDELASFLKSVAKPGFITVTEEGRSPGGRPVLLVRLNRGGEQARFRVLFYAQQHGDEVSGKDALAYLVRAIAERPERLPEDVDLYLMPMLNPDGAAAYRRSNGAGADLNRDHLLQSQPEVQAFHRVARRVMPHLAADLHEFTRDGEAHARRGWERWPLITMDPANHPLIPASLREEGGAWVDSAGPVLARAGHRFDRYTLGGAPPDDEIRPSTLEADDARNGLGSQGALSFIIEVGVRRRASNPQADLGQRVDACLQLLHHLLGTPESRIRIRALSDQARQAPLPPFIAINVFWANRDGQVRPVKVVEAATGRVQEIPTPNLMLDPVVKQGVPTPRVYAIEARAARAFRALLDRHGIIARELGRRSATPSRPAACCGWSPSTTKFTNATKTVRWWCGGRRSCGICLREPCSFPWISPWPGGRCRCSNPVCSTAFTAFPNSATWPCPRARCRSCACLE